VSETVGEVQKLATHEEHFAESYSMYKTVNAHHSYTIQVIENIFCPEKYLTQP